MYARTLYIIYRQVPPAALLVLTLFSCVTGDDLPADTTAPNRIALAFNVVNRQGGTRMTAEATQSNRNFLGVQDWYLLPFNNNALITDNKPPITDSQESLSGNVVDDVKRYETNTAAYYYYNDWSVNVPDQTNSFLCYCKANPDEPTPFGNGKLVPSGLKKDGKVKTDEISFKPVIIHNDVRVNDTAQAIADYLTDIANLIRQAKKDSFNKFVNEGHPIAASSTNAAKLADWAKTNGGVTELPAIANGKVITGYPKSINLPDGAAIVKWNGQLEKFEPQTETTQEANINSLNRFIYPAELWYYANSNILTSEELLTESLGKATWQAVLADFANGGTVMQSTVHSIAIVDSLQYAVGRLDITIDNSSVISANKYPLTAVFVSGQYEQAYNFTPIESSQERIIYDNVFDDATTTDSYPTTHTLVLQSKEVTPVRIALEFTNNDKDFTEKNGTVFKGTKFYLIGTIMSPTYDSSKGDYTRRVFTKDHITTGTVTISSLQNAYPYLPDLLDPRLEIGIKLVTDWIQSTTTNVPL